MINSAAAAAAVGGSQGVFCGAGETSVVIALTRTVARPCCDSRCQYTRLSNSDEQLSCIDIVAETYVHSLSMY